MNIQGLAKSFIEQAQKTPDRVFARTTDGTVLSFRALSDAADAMIAWLTEHGVRPGDTVAVMTRNSPATLALVHGLLRSGMIWVPVNPALVGDGLVHAIRLVDAAIAVCDPELESILAECEAQPREGVLVLHSRGLPAAPATRPAFEVAGPTGLASIMFTSGTTGPAKGVRVTQTMLEIAARGVEEVGRLQDGDNLFMWEPNYHVGGAQVMVLPILRDVSLTIAEK